MSLFSAFVKGIKGEKYPGMCIEGPVQDFPGPGAAHRQVQQQWLWLESEDHLFSFRHSRQSLILLSQRRSHVQNQLV
ncbi:hypothetical protein NPIL_401761 [Nephila pilipes]|uniref:Uncharacterized protein n=1 Tax=Nephila pilipes TaxID=299642 RepID=A0A8X6MCA1_NEPPI|nr:hypothetical protein NPIL_401761 [Nephila pilipes]